MKYVNLSTRRQQAGLTMWGWSGILIMVLLIATVSIKVAPFYFDYLTIAQIAKDIKTEIGSSPQTTGDLRGMVAKRFRSNNVRDVEANALTFKRNSSGGVTAVISYEKRVNVLANIDAVVVFYKEIE